VRALVEGQLQVDHRWPGCATSASLPEAEIGDLTAESRSTNARSSSDGSSPLRRKGLRRRLMALEPTYPASGSIR
jgi:hypothetical protein